MEIKGLVLEGGGAKGAYQASVLNTLVKNGYKFDVVIGTSIGALNGAMYAQGSIDECMELWDNVSASSIVDIDDNYVNRVSDKELSKDVLEYFFDYVRNAISSRGLSTAKVEALIDNYIDEVRLRRSVIDYGLVTVEWKGGMSAEPVVLFKNQIEFGKLKDYIMASASFPAFKPKVIDGKRYVDGGFKDNMPIKPLLDLGCKDILVIRTNTGEFKPDYDVKDAVIRIITPTEKAGSTIGFVKDRIDKSLKLGRYDARKFLDNYAGNYYYVKPAGDEEVIRFLAGLSDERFKRLAELCKCNPNLSKRTIIKKTAALVLEELKMKSDCKLFDAYVALFELFAMQLKIEKFQFYTFGEFARVVGAVYREKNYPEIKAGRRIKSLIGFDKAADILKTIFGDEND